MREAQPPVQYLVGTPRGRLTQYEKRLTEIPWQVAREGVSVKLLAEGAELYVLAESKDRVNKERAMRRRQLKGLWKRLQHLQKMELKRDALLKKLGAALHEYPAGARLIQTTVAAEKAAICCAAISPAAAAPKNSGNFTFNSPKWRRPSKISRATWPCVRFTINWNIGSKRTFSFPSWLIACR
jgi:hypothetical protein